MNDKWIEMSILLLEVNDVLIDRFFDRESEEMLDEKIDVLSKLISGVKPDDIPNYYKILELYPEGEMWD